MAPLMTAKPVTPWAWTILHHMEQFKILVECWQLGGIYRCWFWHPLPCTTSRHMHAARLTLLYLRRVQATGLLSLGHLMSLTPWIDCGGSQQVLIIDAVFVSQFVGDWICRLLDTPLFCKQLSCIRKCEKKPRKVEEWSTLGSCDADIDEIYMLQVNKVKVNVGTVCD